MSKRGVFYNKRAMSPLIATVLLIAFAVAMGAMIMNWSTSLGDAKGPDCSGIKMIMNPTFCYSDNAIILNVKNTGMKVDGLELKISDDDAENVVSIKNSQVDKGGSISKEIPFTLKSTTSVELTALLEYQGKLTECQKPILQVIDLQSCSK